MQATGNLCLKCAFKHLSIARVVLGELLYGWNNVVHVSRAIGHLACAEEHLANRPRLVERIRSFRITSVEERFDGSGDTPDRDELAISEMYLTLEDLLADIKRLIGLEGSLDEDGPEPSRVTTEVRDWPLQVPVAPFREPVYRNEQWPKPGDPPLPPAQIRYEETVHGG